MTRLIAITVLSLALAIAIAIAPAPVHAHTRITTDVTWGEEVRDIFIEKCMTCHRPGGIAPDWVDLTVYGTDTEPAARAWAVSIEEEILTGQMPPWQADPRFSRFSNAPTLTQDEIDIIVGWVRGGAPQGPKRNLPIPPEVLERDWLFGEPSIAMELREPVVLPEDQDYAVHTETFPVEIEEDTFIIGYEFFPDQVKNIKSMTAWIHDPDGYEPEPVEVEVQVEYDPLLAEEELEQTRLRQMPKGPHFLGAWYRGDSPVLLPDEAGKLLRKGSSIELEIVYERPEFAEWNEVRDQSRLGLHTAFEVSEIDLLVETRHVENASFTVPANAKGHEVVAETTFEESVHLVSLTPRMNRLGDSLGAKLIYPDGFEEVLLYLPSFDWRWNSNYVFDQPVAAPAGSTLVLTGRYDNTEDNWDNPNSPPADVSAGTGRFDAQLLAMVDYALDDHLYVEEPFMPDPEEDAIERAGGGMSFFPNVAEVGENVEAEQAAESSPTPEVLAAVIEESGGDAAEIYWCPMRGNPCEMRDYHGPGTCDDCWMDLKPKSSFFEGQDIAAEKADWNLTRDGVSNTYWCPNRGRADHALTDYDAPGACEVCEETLLHKTRFEFVPTFKCLTTDCDLKGTVFFGPGLCPSCGQPATGLGHMDHNPVHGGWQFFMADNMYHHLEGTMPEPGLFKLYIYDDWKRGLDGRNFQGSVFIEREDPETGEVTEDEYPLYVGRPGDEFLLADLPDALPVEFYTRVSLAGEMKRYDWSFDELTTEPEITLAVREHDHPPDDVIWAELNAPDDTLGLAALLLERDAMIAEIIDAKDWFSLHIPAVEAKLLMEALAARDHSNLNVRQRGDLKQAVGAINRGALGLDRAGDAADAPRVERAYEGFQEGIESVRELFPEATP